ncbi:CHAT domain-containing protein [Yinghuangia seranimata]|uniref:CHAT domain-containing protein n=1 Tax=Yinghuangia seranimata TaxID=408067 RepID=UPI00248CCAB9|nr:CHAT domain-containing protein [Yinghuangia seranimata]MDI2129428.1 CHAT domain-containing protein [Yinghuangia seranimata]
MDGNGRRNTFPGAGDAGQAVETFIAMVDAQDIVTRFDADFDVPMRQAQAVGLLRLAGAYRAAPSATAHDLALRVGAHWCEIVQADVDYQLLTGLRLVEASRRDAERLAALPAGPRAAPEETFRWYVASRWFDGAGRIKYRIGNHTEARLSFGTAVELAEAADLWWVLPDLLSNHERARYEERNQMARPADRNDAALFIEPYQALSARTAALGRANGIDVDAPLVAESFPASARHREFLRGYSNVLHNLATAWGQAGHDTESLETTERSLRISKALGDEYRIAQSMTNRAQRDRPNARAHFEALVDSPWVRGKRIARQRLATIIRGTEGLGQLSRLLDEIGQDTLGSGRQSCMDIDFYAYTVDAYTKVARELPEEDRPADVGRIRLELARTARTAIALPLYKRMYAQHVRPAFLAAIGERAASGDTSRTNLLALLSLVEESSGRELLDLLGSSHMAPLPPPAESNVFPAVGDETAETVAGSEIEAEPEAGMAVRSDFGDRRGPMESIPEDREQQIREELSARESDYEAYFVDHPIPAIDHDEDIAHRLVQYTLNNPGSCVARYFRYADPSDQRACIGTLLCRDGRLRLLEPLPYAEVTDLVERVSADLADKSRRAPGEDTCRAIWNLLVEPVWAAAGRGADLSHLTLIPTDHVFAIPLHVALEPGRNEPLAARVPLSHSVSVGMFIGRQRHLLKRQLVEKDDVLGALLVTDAKATGQEILANGWSAENVAVTGKVRQGRATPAGGERDPDPARIRDQWELGWDGIARLSAREPAFFVYAGHGYYLRSRDVHEPLLRVGKTDVLTQFDLALRFRLPRNKLAIFGACVAGQGIGSPGGDVGGFMRSLIAAGAGAVAVPLWYVSDAAMVQTGRALLSGSRQCVGPDGAGSFDIVETLHAHYQQVMRDRADVTSRINRLPLALYL